MSNYLQRLQNSIASATREMNPANLSRCPAAGKWSAAEVLEHLLLTYKGTMKNLDRALSAGKPLGGIPTIKQRFRNLVVLDFGYFPAGRNSPEPAKPKGMPAAEVLAAIENAINEMEDRIRQCESRFGKSARIGDHPILGPFTSEQWRKFHWVHGKHHVKQILRMRGRAATSQH